jgi:hypothetical protein
MTPVFVDDMYRYPLGRLGRMKMSHMISDDEETLHLMADAIGVQRKWYQGDHYDIAKKMRQRALELGAIPITLRQCGLMCAVRRKTGKLGDPGTC